MPTLDPMTLAIRSPANVELHRAARQFRAAACTLRRFLREDGTGCRCGFCEILDREGEGISLRSDLRLFAAQAKLATDLTVRFMPSPAAFDPIEAEVESRLAADLGASDNPSFAEGRP